MANKIIIVRDLEVFNRKIIESGFSYRQLAKEAKTSQTTISLIANGERNPSANTAVHICRALKCQFDDIFFIENNDKSN